MEETQRSPAASLEEKFVAFATSLTEAEAELFGALVESVHGDEVSGYDFASMGLTLSVGAPSTSNSTLSNLLKKASETASGITQNIK